ncbi:Nonribosomal peptide synthetase 14 [Cytospora mali]|uniref:Nonribosomal peptide synthetase 14 n=1 Tax=Cytospora mali TaxID=578113 RepID=A0A194VJV6_CYTMA|nr:Nonribosomal peptide synthetase 14 [Valsa mali]
MDPQQRILLEVVYEGIEAAGYSLQQLHGSSTGVFVGQMTDDYRDILYRDPDNIPQYTATGISRAILANRISYFFDWRGPSENIDTACSSSLVALHHAVQSLRSGESQLAIAAGANLILGPEMYIAESKLQMLSPTGRSRMWDADADGYARGEGFVAIVLKPLRQAIADQDHIECIIRETGVNQDGHSSTGLTVPSAVAQAALIKSTYGKCGLDYRMEQDRCQYFEAHGTGTAAGDPREAEAICNVFFPGTVDMPSTGLPEALQDTVSSHNKLYVGSIKTVIGHSEGAAGLAALIKASLAVQHAKIPPNMHFHRLNPALEPFYDPHLQVPTKLLSWPTILPGAARRASINSFGFGGTNAHAIIESWDNSSIQTEIISPCPIGPITLSAETETSLLQAIAALSKTLKTADNVDMRNLAWTMHARRSECSKKAAFSAVDKEELIRKLEAACNTGFPSTDTSDLVNESPFANETISLSNELPLRILGVFTGQGAQWPTMGAVLYAHSECFRCSIQTLDKSLSDLPDAPTWTLAEELTAPVAEWNGHLPEISQPLTTALQIALVDLLRVSGVTFAAAIGHSSGEIAALYAAGYISSVDAIRVAYYRGVYAQLALSPTTGSPGKMMAVGMAFEEAHGFCERLPFKNRISVAACNSRSSVTLSGDADAIHEAKELFDERKTFAKILKVETAYHSHHMGSCAMPYLESLRRCQIQPQSVDIEKGCAWFSSVHGLNGRSIQEPDSFRGEYWVENLVKPVLFYQAVDRAVKEAFCFDMALEVGPHPALKGPVTDTFKTLTGMNILYHGVLERGTNDLTAFADALGFIWKNVRPSALCLDLDGFMQACSSSNVGHPHLLTSPRLPSYSWDHHEPLFKESHQSRCWRKQERPVHELLGRVVSHGHADHLEMHWRVILKLSEVKWLRGHQFQHQVLFPATGYVSMAIEAARFLAAEMDQLPRVKLIELRDLKYHKAMSLDEQSFPSGVEVHFIIRVVRRDSKHIVAEYSCHSGDADAGTSPEIDKLEHTNFTGIASVMVGDSSHSSNQLPSRIAPNLPLSSVETKRFYAWASSIGLQYSGDFLADSIKRRLNIASVWMKRLGNTNSNLLVHPATLDVAFHGVFAAYTFPNDGRMRLPYLPSSIDVVRVNMPSEPWEATTGFIGYPGACKHERAGLVADCYIQEINSDSSAICGDVDVYCASASCHHPEIQVQGLTCSVLTKPTSRDDRKIFARNIWMRDISAGLTPEDMPPVKASILHGGGLYDIYERTAYFFLRDICRQVKEEEVKDMEWHFQCLMDWALFHVLPTVEAGNHPRVRAEWSSDDYDSIMKWKQQYPHDVDLEVLHALGHSLPAIIRGTLPILQTMMEDDRLGRLYKEGSGCPQANHILGSLIGQLSHRYPRMRILEVGAGTGAATAAALKHLGQQGAFDSYTFTDVSPGFFESARDTFSSYRGKMRYHVLDIERSPTAQELEAHSFDLIIASNVLHATRSLADTLANCRELLRPGGHLIILEFTGNALYLQFLFSALPGWWLGRDDGRKYHPTIPESQWDTNLRKSGFSGIDYVARDCEDSSKYVFSVMVSQAMDERVDLLRQPLSMRMGEASGVLEARVDNFVVIGDHTSSRLTELACKIQLILTPFASRSCVITDWERLGNANLSPRSAVICLYELEHAVLDSNETTEMHFRAIQSICNTAGYILWATRGCRADEPLTNMMVGAGRSIMMESSHISMQFVDAASSRTDPVVFPEMLLRMILLDLPEFKDVLWSNETETAIDDGRLYIPRVLLDDELNCRINSGSRRIERSIPLASTVVEVTQDNDGSRVFEDILTDHNFGDHAKKELVKIKVHKSSLLTLSTLDSDPVYICFGWTPEANQSVVAVSPTNASTLKLPPSQVIKWQGNKSLRRLLATLICESLFTDVTKAIWLHDADSEVATVALQTGSSQRIQVFLSTSTPNPASGTTYIHEHTPLRALESLIPRNVEKLVYFGVDNESVLEGVLAAFAYRIKAAVQRPRREIIRYSTVSLKYRVAKLYEVINAASNSVSGLTILEPSRTEERGAVRLSQVPQLSRDQSQNLTTVIDWVGEEAVPVRIQPRNTHGLFSGHKTYFLVGLTGEVGMSLIEWMTNNGARYFAIASRNPVIDAEVIKYLESKQVNIKVLALDVANKTALRLAHQDIVSTMPPIAGVANGAMVLRDKAFSSISWADFKATLQPKVDGSKNLDELFYNDSLEFFVLFSSMASFVGNPGQSNYGAANMFMASLAAQRRKRGVAASVIHLGLLLGLGHFARSLDTGSNAESQLRNKFSVTSFSETDLHAIFAEAIVSGRADSKLDPGLLMGFESNTSDNNDPDARWRRVPLFSHFSENVVSAKDVNHAYVSVQDIQSQLTSAGNLQDALVILEQAFTEKLGAVLQCSSDKVNRKMPLVAMGFDSLVAVEVRSWFLKELAVDMPILKLLGGASLEEICRDAAVSFVGFKFNKRDQDVPPGHSVATSTSFATDDQSHPTSPGEKEKMDPMVGYPTSSVHSISELEEPSTSPEILSVGSSELSPPSPPKTTYKKIGEMSHSQARLYFLHMYLDDKSTYNVGYVGEYCGRLDLDRLRKALYDVGMQHESIRSSYFIDKTSNLAVQAINEEPRIELNHKENCKTSDIQNEIDLQRHFEFDIEHGHVMKVTVLSRSTSIHQIIFLYHHIVLDGVSWFLFINDLHRAFSGHPIHRPVQQAIEMSVKEHQRRSLIYPDSDELKYWQELYRSPHEPLPLLPFSKTKSRQTLNVYGTESLSIELDHSLTRLVKETASELCVTPFHVYLCALAVFLRRLEVEDFSIGIVDSNRPDAEDAETIGYFLNMIPLRFQIKKHETFAAITQRAHDMVFAAMSRSSVPFDAILDHLRVPRSASHHPLFQTALNYRQGYTTKSPLGNGGTIKWDTSVSGTISAGNPYDLALDVSEVSGTTFLHWTTQKYMYGTEDSASMMRWYVRILEGVCQNTEVSMASCPVSNDADLRHMFSLGEGNSIEFPADWKGTLAHRIETIAAVYPQATALVDGYDHRLKYCDMMGRVHQISQHLCTNSTALVHGSYVGVLLDPGANQVCTFLAIMRLGLVYVPLDLRNPVGRLSEMVWDCRPQVLVCSNSTKEMAVRLAINIPTEVINLDDYSSLSSCKNQVEHIPEVHNVSNPNQLAIILYTSGSTGVPKGVLLSHANVLNHILIYTSLYDINDQDVILQQSSLGFDLSLGQTFTALANGGTLIIVSPSGRGDPSRLAQIMLAENVTYTLFVTSEYLSLLNYGVEFLRKCSRWRLATQLGEKLTPQLRASFRKLGLPSLKLVNAYGPTEGTIACATGFVPYAAEHDIVAQSDSLWPMPNYALVVADEQMNPLPVGFPGEILIAGAGVAIGYLNRPDEERQRFVEMNITSSSDGRQPKTRMYRTGDRGRLLEDGTLNILGRLADDGQVKIRGHRVELDEIASVIVKMAAGVVVSAAVSYRAVEDVLVAFLVYDATFSADKNDFAEKLKAMLPLPAYMCPTILVPIDSIPLNINGKQDRKAVDRLQIQLADGGRYTSALDDENALTATEMQVKEIWEEVVPTHIGQSIQRISRTSDFFQVGGNSMLVIKLRSLLQKRFGVTIPLPELFQLRTLKAMATRMQLTCTDYDSIQAPPVDMDWDSEVAGLYNGLAPHPMAGNVPSTCKVEQEPNKSEGLNVILTGATGFLGTYILQRLADNPRVDKIHCVAIRPDSTGNSRHVTVTNNKIVEWGGDLGNPRLGLSEQDFQYLAATVHTIIHNGSSVSFLKSYHTLRGSNVVSTKTICELALTHRIPVHYISSAAVAAVAPGDLGAEEALPAVSVARWTPPSNPELLDGYALSKWVSESLLERVAADHALPVWIHRPASILGEGAPGLDVMTAIVGFSRELDAVPAMDGLQVRGSFDLVGVENVAMDLVLAVLESVDSSKSLRLEGQQPKVRFVHYCGETKVCPDGLGEYLERMDGRSIGRIPMKEWLDGALEKGLSQALYDFLGGLTEGEGKVVLPAICK